MKKIVVSVVGVLLVAATVMAYMAYNAVMAPVVKNEQIVYIQIHPTDALQV